jgi:hypothetical protein
MNDKYVCFDDISIKTVCGWDQQRRYFIGRECIEHDFWHACVMDIEEAKYVAGMYRYQMAPYEYCLLREVMDG